MKEIQKTHCAMGGVEPSATLAITSKAKSMIAAGEDVCNMCAGEPDFDTPQHIKDAAVEALRKGETKYTPESGLLNLRKAISEKLLADNKLSYAPEQIVVAPGAKFSVFCGVAALCGKGDEVILPSPYWLSYYEIIKAAQATPVVLPCRAEDNYEPALDELEKAVTPNTRLMILNTPSNPTGAVYRRSTLEKIAQIAVKHNFMVLSDEIYEKLVYDAEFPHVSIASFSPEIAALTITVNGFSKAFAMTGWRLGYMAAPQWLIKKVAALQSHTASHPTTFAQSAAVTALKGDQRPVEEMRKAFSQRRDLIYGLLSRVPGLKCIRPQGAFYIFCDVSSFGMGSWEFCEKLLNEKKVAAIPGKPFGAEGNIRLSYACSDETIKKACQRIKEFCAGIKK